MTFSKMIKFIIILALIVGGLYAIWEPASDFVAGLMASRTGRSPESTAAAFGIAVDQGIAGFTGETQIGALKRAKTKITEADLATLRNAIEIYRLNHNGQMPQSLDALVKAGVLSGNQVLRDPWGTDYNSQWENGTLYIISAGEDRLKGTDDDQIIDMTAPAKP